MTELLCGSPTRSVPRGAYFEECAHGLDHVPDLLFAQVAHEGDKLGVYRTELRAARLRALPKLRDLDLKGRGDALDQFERWPNPTPLDAREGLRGDIRRLRDLPLSEAACITRAADRLADRGLRSGRRHRPRGSWPEAVAAIDARIASCA